MKAIVLLALLFSSVQLMAAGLEGKTISIGAKVYCEGWPDYEKSREMNTRRIVIGEIADIYSKDRIGIYGRISNPASHKDTTTSSFLLYKKMCVYYDEYLKSKNESVNNSPAFNDPQSSQDVAREDNVKNEKEISDGAKENQATNLNEKTNLGAKVASLIESARNGDAGLTIREVGDAFIGNNNAKKDFKINYKVLFNKKVLLELFKSGLIVCLSFSMYFSNKINSLIPRLFSFSRKE